MNSDIVMVHYTVTSGEDELRYCDYDLHCPFGGDELIHCDDKLHCLFGGDELIYCDG